MSEKRKILALQRKCHAEEAKIKRIQISVTIGCKDDIGKAKLKVYAQANYEAYKLYCAAYEELLGMLSSLDLMEEDAKMVAVEDMFYEMQGIITSLIDKFEENGDTAVPKDNKSVIVATPGLSQIPFPTFDGKYENWFRFKALFQEIMAKHPNEADATKLYHLDKALVSGARGAINQQTLNDNDYNGAWKLLMEKFENLRTIIDIHINGLLNLKNMSKGTANELKFTVAECVRHVDALKFYKKDVTGMSEIMIVNLLVDKLDGETRKLWEATIPHGCLPKYDETIAFLQSRCSILERVEVSEAHSAAKLTKVRSTTAIKNIAGKAHTATAEGVTNDNCMVCNNNHTIYKCTEFKNMPVEARFEKAKQLGICFNCLQKRHRTIDCKSKWKCSICDKRHHYLLHFVKKECITNEVTDTNVAIESTQKESYENDMNMTGSSLCHISTARQIILSTAIVYIADVRGSLHEARVLLDSGSQLNFISEQMAIVLGLKRESVNAPIVGINETKTNAKFQMRAKIKSMNGTYATEIKFLIVPKVTCSLPQTAFDISKWNLPAGVKFADPRFNVPGRIDLLIGAEIFFELINDGQIRMSNDLPLLQETKLGWIVSGPVATPSVSLYAAFHHCTDNELNENVDDMLRKFWEIEECFVSSSETLENQHCEKHFIDTHTRDENGRYGVMLPFRNTALCLGRSKHLALKRFEKLEQKLNRFPDIKTEYVKFINEYKMLGHCQEINDNENEFDEDGKSYYLPHHCVIKSQSSTTRLRVVFDASAKSTTNVSLNDILITGPVVQNDLISIIMRFRTFRFAFTADLSKMYRQVRVHQDQTSYQRILWRSSTNECIKTYELLTLTYGTASAAYLATRVLNQLANDECENFPIASKVLREDFYVDDVLSGADTCADAIEKQRQLILLLNSGGFHIHKWCANVAELLEDIPVEDREKFMSFEGNDANNTIKALGILWNPIDDEFMFQANLIIDDAVVTKRKVLSIIAKLFDPLGLIGPVIVWAKLFMQELWKLRLQWDDQLPNEMIIRWHEFCTNLSLLKNMKIRRFVMIENADRIEIHGFADASLRAYGACVYICSWKCGKPYMQLFSSKSKVSPINSTTPEELKIPRLELNAALLLSKLIDKILNSTKIEADVKLWSDSRIVLAWLKKSPSQLNVYVANRITKIQQLTYEHTWHYVPTKLNPADVISRGRLPNKFINDTLWHNGPQELLINEKTIVSNDEFFLTNEKIPELRNEMLALPTIKIERFEPLYKFESFRKTQRIFAYVNRFIHNMVIAVRKNSDRRFGRLTIIEIRLATVMIFRRVQLESFCDEIRGQIGRNNIMLNLNPFIDKDGLLRVGGRIGNADISYDKRHQIILPSNNHVTKSLILALHYENAHIGMNGLLAIVRQRFWPIRAKKMIRKIVRQCIDCFYARPPKINQYMGDLPVSRVNMTYPFIKTGMDYAGPIYLKQRQRKAPKIKAYIAIFVCMATKAIHIELVSDMTSDSFIAALQRFVSRRGNVAELFSDNGTNFVGANNELHELYNLFKNQHCNDVIDNFCQSREIKFNFIPPRAPHFGGLWESCVKSIKTHLRKLTAESSLTYEEMNTLLILIEGVLNSRPLIAQSDDINDLTPLTPSHFLIGRELSSIPEPSYENIKINKLSPWQRVQQLRQHYWKRWSNEYLTQLQHRSKWFKDRHEIKIGMLVVIREDNMPPNKWALGRIMELYPGNDGIVRVVSLKTSSGIIKRCVGKLSILPIDVETPVSPGENVCSNNE